MELFNNVLKYILKSKTRLLDLRVCSPFCSITFRCRILRPKLGLLPGSNLCRQQNYLLFKLLRVIYLAKIASFLFPYSTKLTISQNLSPLFCLF